MDILLGIFGKRFNTMQQRTNAKVFPFYDLVNFAPPRKNDIKSDMMSIVSIAAIKASTIHFILDDIEFPISPNHSFACAELELIFETESFFEKTVFWLRLKQLSDEQLFQLICSKGRVRK